MDYNFALLLSKYIIPFKSLILGITNLHTKCIHSLSCLIVTIMYLASLASVSLLIFLSFGASAAPEINYLNFKKLDSKEFDSLANKVEQVTSMDLPQGLKVIEVEKDPQIASALYFDEVRLTKHDLVKPIFVHELAHILVHYHLNLDVSEIKDRYVLEKRISSTNYGSSEWDELLKEFGPRYDPRGVSLFLEEVFGDLLASHIFNDPGVMDKLEVVKGFRNFDIDTKEEIAERYYDPHYALQPFGKYVFQNFLKSGKVEPSIIFRAFYELVKNETSDYVLFIADKSKPLYFQSPLVTKINGKLMFNEKNLNEYIEELKIKFDNLVNTGDSHL